jgi:RHS repeat-associated protein
MDGDNVLMDFTGTAANSVSLSHRYMYGPAVDQVMAQEDVTSLTSAGTTLWQVTDNQNTVRDLVASDGTVAAHFNYDPYGNLISAADGSGNTITNVGAVTYVLYTGRAFEFATGLQYNRARWFDPAVGRWISEDPIGFKAGDTNIDRYVGNDPVDGVDPKGTTKQIFAFEGRGGFPATAVAGAHTKPKYDDKGELEFLEGAASLSQVLNFVYPAVARAGGDFDWHYYAQDQVGAAVNDIEHYAKLPRSEHYVSANSDTCAQYDTITLIGYSNGAAAVLQAAKALERRNIQVDLVLTIDPIRDPLDGALLGRKLMRTNYVDNVTKWHNIFQRMDTGSLGGIVALQGQEVVGADSNTEVFKQGFINNGMASLVDTAHIWLPGYPATTKMITSNINALPSLRDTYKAGPQATAPVAPFLLPFGQ